MKINLTYFLYLNKATDVTIIVAINNTTVITGTITVVKSEMIKQTKKPSKNKKIYINRFPSTQHLFLEEPPVMTEKKKENQNFIYFENIEIAIFSTTHYLIWICLIIFTFHIR